jgi:hypothetical protein
MLDLLEYWLWKKRNDLKSFLEEPPKSFGQYSRRKIQPKKTNFHEFDDIAINKTAKDRAIIENLMS